MTEWIMGRMQEPSTYAAIGVSVVGAGVLASNFWVVVAGIVVGVGAFVLKERR
jgi:hypothetical protein